MLVLQYPAIMNKNDRNPSFPSNPKTVMEAFEKTSLALQQFGIERVRVEGLSGSRVSSSFSSNGDDVRTITEQDFMREFVFHLRPCIIVDGLQDWQAMKKWRNDRYLFNLDHHLPPQDEEDHDEEGEEEDERDVNLPSSSEWNDSSSRGSTLQVKKRDEKWTEGCSAVSSRHSREVKVTIALTPNGRADAVTRAVYDEQDVPLPWQQEMFSEQAKRDACYLSSHPAIAEEEGKHISEELKKKNGASLRMEKMFMAAAEVRVTLPEFYQLLQHNCYPTHVSYLPTHIDMRRYTKDWNTVIAYGQLQNNCLNTEYTHLLEDIPPNIKSLGTRVFGQPPEASNVWFGTGESVSSLHQDWVENLYCVVRGVKEFVLIPPWESIFLPKPDIPSATFVIDESRSNRDELDFRFVAAPKKDGEVMPWIDYDVTPDEIESSSNTSICDKLNRVIEECHREHRKSSSSPSIEAPIRYAPTLHPLVAHVHPGETLYLPSMWLHRVSQRADSEDILARAQCRRKSAEKLNEEDSSLLSPSSSMPLPLIAAVNYWYDMSFDNPSVVMLREFGLLL